MKPTLNITDMEEFTIEKKNHNIKVIVQDRFVEAVVMLSKDLFLRMTMKSNNMSAAAKAAYEQQVYGKLVQGIFNEKATYIYLFSSAQELYDYKASKDIKVANNSSNNWFKTACIGISSWHPKDEILDYIRRKSDEFEKRTFILP